ncbi:MAG: DUF4214 domain-containing protein [Saccharofermentans sp.]|nr:DUF4214 domain-containing protein [Saccharofermentans sp.]
MKTKVRLLSLFLSVIFIVSMFPVFSRVVKAEEYPVSVTKIRDGGYTAKWSKVDDAMRYIVVLENINTAGESMNIFFDDADTNSIEIPDDVFKKYGNGGVQYQVRVEIITRTGRTTIRSDYFNSYRYFDLIPRCKTSDNAKFSFDNKNGLEKSLSYVLKEMNSEGEYVTVAENIVPMPAREMLTLDLSAYIKEMHDYQLEYSLKACRTLDRDTGIEVKEFNVPCSHSKNEWVDQYSYDDEYHWRECSVCEECYGKGKHVFSETTFKDGMMYSVCDECLAPIELPDTRQAVTNLNVNTKSVAIGQTVQAPSLGYSNAGLIFEMTDYAWYKGTPSSGEKLAVGTPYDYGTYTLVISAKIKDANIRDAYIDESTFHISASGYVSKKWTTTENTVTGEITFVIKGDSTVELKTPEISPNMYISDFYKNTKVIVDGKSTPLTETEFAFNVINLDNNQQYYYYNTDPDAYYTNKNIRFGDIGTDNIQINLYVDSVKASDYTLNKEKITLATMTAVKSCTVMLSLQGANYRVYWKVDYDLSECPEPTPEPTPATGVEGFCERLYTCALGRASDPAGVKSWVDAIKGGADGAKAARGFFFSDEFINKKLDNKEYVTRLYKTFMDREPDAAGLNAWVEALEKGASREKVFDGFVNSVEWANICFKYGIKSGGTATPSIRLEPSAEILAFAERLYTTCLGRSADPSGLKAWADALANREGSGAKVARGFFFSDEFINKKYDNGEFVRRCYLTFMDREPDTAGYDAWVKALNEGASREKVFDGFTQSPEFVALCEKFGIIPY